MTAISPDPITCRCGRTMRIAVMRDAYECRCGLWLGGDVVYAAQHSSKPILPEAFQQGEPWPEPAPGLRVSDNFSDIGIGWEVLDIEPARGPAPLEWQRMCADAFECSGLRYIHAVKNGARTLALPETGDELSRHAVYALVPLGQEREAVTAIVRFIRDKHGSGKLWTHGDIPIGPLKKRTQAGWRGTELGGVLHVVMGCYYYHKPIN